MTSEQSQEEVKDPIKDAIEQVNDPAMSDTPIGSKVRSTGLIDKLKILQEKKANGEEIKSEDKINVAVLADSPTVATGFGNVCREILKLLHDTGFYNFEVVGINYDGSPHDLPYKIHPAFNGLIPDPTYRDLFGKQKFLDVLGSGKHDIAWVLQDSFIISELGEYIAQTNEAMPADSKFTFIFYFPIDAIPKKLWIDRSVMLADYPVVYTKYGYDEVLKLYHVGEDTLLTKEEQEKNKKDSNILQSKMNIIYHGCNLDDFHPLEEEEIVKLREQFWNIHKDKFVFINVNRNQPRKDYFRTLKAFKILLDRRRAKGKDDVYLYCHCNILDTGLNLIDMAKQIQLVDGDEFAFPDPKNFGPNSGFPLSMVNKLYNAADAVISTTLGEGWGLSLTEAMAVKRPIIAPDNTSIPEILGKTNSGGVERGFIVKTKGDFVQHDDNSRVRPITDPEDLADKMEWVVENREKLQPIVDKAYEWVKALAWEGELVGAKWKMLFEDAYKMTLVKRAFAFDEMLANTKDMKNLGRNDMCPICKVKFKNCRHYELKKS